MTQSQLRSFAERSLPTKKFEILPLAGDASPRKYFRVVDGELTWVLMEWEAFDPETSPFISIQKHFAKNFVHVPEILDLDAQHGLMLLEDLGDLTLERKFWERQEPETSIPFYELALDELFKIHGAASENSAAGQKKTSCVAFDVAFDTKKLLWEMNYALQNLVLGVLGFSFKSEKAKKDIEDCFLSICDYLSNQPRRICHRDYHSRNLMLKKGKIFVIDFQDARMGPLAYDLVSLFHDSYVAIPESMERTLLNTYLAQAKIFMPAGSLQDFDRSYQVQKIQRVFKACGSFSSFYQERGDRRYLKYLTPSLQKLFSALDQLPEMSVLKNLLVDSGAFEKNYLSL